MLESFKYKKKTKEYIYIKRVIYPKNKTIFDFMIHSFNNESKVVKSSILDVLKTKIINYLNISNISIEVKI